MSGGGKIPEYEEVIIFNLVADPFAEGDVFTAIRRADSLLTGVAMEDTLKGYIMLERNSTLGSSGYIIANLVYTDTVLEFARSQGLAEVDIQILQNRGIAFRRLQNQCLILTVALITCILVICAGCFLWIHVSRVRGERELHKAQMEFIRGLEHERGRVARELHDDVAGDLVGLQYDVLTGSPEENSMKIAALTGKVRRLSHDMMPPEFEEYDLPRLLEDLVITNNATGRVRVKTHVEGSYDWLSLDARSNLNLYRIVQEIINNALKYAPNPEVEITLGGTGAFSLVIESAGVADGKSTETPEKGIGHSIMIIRATLAGASIEVVKKGGKIYYNIKEIK